MKINSQKGFIIPVIIVIVILLAVIWGVLSSVKKEEKSSDVSIIETEDGKKMESGENGEMINGVKGEETRYSGSLLAGKSSPLLDFTKADYDKALSSDKVVVLYFFANWCPTCKKEFPLMEKAFNELSSDKVVGFLVNYNDDQTDDDERNLAREFGVAYQHTKVFLKDGQRILKSPESWNKDRYLNELNNVLEI